MLPHQWPAWLLTSWVGGIGDPSCATILCLEMYLLQHHYVMASFAIPASLCQQHKPFRRVDIAIVPVEQQLDLSEESARHAAFLRCL